MISEGGLLPIPYEVTTSLMAGTREGPREIINSSRYLELSDEETGCEVYRLGIYTLEELETVSSSPAVVIGDHALFLDSTGRPLPGIAPVAIQQGGYVARLIGRRLRGQSLPPFRFRDGGSPATIGRAAAVADLGRLRFSGYLAWLAWLFVHLMNLVLFSGLWCWCSGLGTTSPGTAPPRLITLPPPD